MSPQAPKSCVEKVKLLNDYYRTTVHLAELTDRLAEMTDTNTPEFHAILESVREAREAVEIRALPLNSTLASMAVAPLS